VAHPRVSTGQEALLAEAVAPPKGGAYCPSGSDGSIFSVNGRQKGVRDEWQRLRAARGGPGRPAIALPAPSAGRPAAESLATWEPTRLVRHGEVWILIRQPNTLVRDAAADRVLAVGHVWHVQDRNGGGAGRRLR